MRLTRLLSSVMLIALASTFECHAASAASVLRASDSREERRIGPGTTYIHDYRSSGPLNFNIVRVDLNNSSIAIEAEKPGDQLFSGARVTAMAGEETKPGHTVIAGVNGDFWTMTPRPYIPIGLIVSDGMIYNTPFPRSVLAFTEDGQPYLGVLSMQLTLSAGGKTLEIPVLNDARSTHTAALYTPPFATLRRSGATHVIVKLDGKRFLPNEPVTGTVKTIVSGRDTQVATGTVVLALRGTSPRQAGLQPGTKVQLLASVPEVPGVIVSCVGGGPRIVRDGKVDVEFQIETMGRNFSTERHPRTAVGLSADRNTLVLLTVDGRQPLVSIGQNLYELAAEMLRQGCADAINLDGGGSTTMVVRGEVKNRPSDLKGPRTVANALMVVSKAVTGPLAELQIEPAAKRLHLPAETTVSLVAKGYDRDFNPVDLSRTALSWTVDPDVGSIISNGAQAVLKTGTTNGFGSIRVSAQPDISGTLAAETHAHYAMSLDPPVQVLASGEKGPLAISVEAEGTSLFLQPTMFSITGATGKVFAAPDFVEGRSAGQEQLRVRLGTAEAVLPCFVDTYKGVTLAGWDTSPADTLLSGTNFDLAGSRITLDTNQKKDGAASLSFTYVMKRGGTSKIMLPVNSPIKTEPAKFGVWIYGDGKEEWVRAELVDSDDHRFLLDFTDGSKGVYWKGQWKHVLVPVRNLTARPSNPSATIRFPAVLKEVYIAQDQEALKASGTVLLDKLEAIYSPIDENFGRGLD